MAPKVTRLLLCGLAFGLACAHPAPRPVHEGVQNEAPLALPPGPKEMAFLQRAAGAPGCGRGLQAAQLLFDLYDVAKALRGENDELSKEQRRLGKATGAFLREAMGLDPLDPLSALDQRLRGRFKALASRCGHRGQRWLEETAKLLALDAVEARRGAEAFRWGTALRRRVLLGGPLAGNARGRLLQRCARAFRHALREDPRRQRPVLGRCLHALFEADPAPYFAADPADRPPEPPWTLLRRRLAAALKEWARTRFAPLAQLQLRADAAFFKRHGAELPAAVNLARFHLPKSARGLPFDRTPLVTVLPELFVVDGLVTMRGDEAALRAALRKRLRGDDRGQLSVVMAAGAPVGPLYVLGRAAQREKVHTLLLGVRRLVAHRAAPGDVQALLASRGGVWRLEGIPISTRLLALRPREKERDQPRTLLYDPLATPGRLALFCTAARWQVESAYGQGKPLRAGDLAGLREQLERFARLFPDEQGMILAVAHTLSYAQLIAILEVVRYAGRRPLFPAVALAPRFGITTSTRPLEPLLEALEGARVQPPSAAGGAPSTLISCCRRALASSYVADEPLTALLAPPPGKPAGSGQRAWAACLAGAGGRPGAAAVQCLPGAKSPASTPEKSGP